MKPRNDPEIRRRSCVVDLNIGDTWYELPQTLDSEHRWVRPALHVAADEGPIGRPASHILYDDRTFRVRGARARDRSHKTANAIKLASVESGDFLTVLETTVANNYLHGPFKGNANINAVFLHGRRWVKHSTHRNPLFQQFYGAICRREKLVGADYGAEQHQIFVWTVVVPGAAIFSRMGKLIKLMRWKAWAKGME